MEHKKWLSVEEVASRFGLSNRHVRRLVSIGVLRGEKDGRTWRIDPKSVESLLNRRRASTLEERLAAVEAKVNALLFLVGETSQSQLILKTKEQAEEFTKMIKQLSNEQLLDLGRAITIGTVANLVSLGYRTAVLDLQQRLRDLNTKEGIILANSILRYLNAVTGTDSLAERIESRLEARLKKRRS